MKYFLYTLLFLAVLIVPDIIQKKRREKRLKKYIEQVWGSEEDRLDEPVKDFDPISAFYKNMARQEDGFFIDDITWNDLLMDDVYNRINHTMSVCGEQYLYYMMRRTEEDEALLRKRIETLELFQKNPDQLKDIQYHLMEYGKNRSFDFSKYFFEHSGDIAEKNIRYVLQAVLLLLSPLLFLIDRSLGIVTAFLLAGNIITHYTGSKRIRKNLTVLTWIVDLIKCGEKIKRKNYAVLKDFPLRKALRDVHSMKIKGFHYFIFESQNIILEYLKAAFLLELILYGKFMKLLQEKRNEFLQLYCLLGKIDSYISVASVRGTYPVWCTPEFLQEGPLRTIQKKAYHPLISYPVPNDLYMDKCILITGSNASGKSTFLKTVAINAIFAQTICTCFAEKYRSSIVNVYTSMALRDDIVSQESYYIVEIKSLKRILDAVEVKKNVLCFIDEVLRGTNTIERIAASSEILKNFSRSGALCMAATHDIELAEILEELYENYHFQEHITDDDITFDYILYPGKTGTRNAIQLLRLMGYPPEIVEKAHNNARRFLDTGAWR